MINKLDLAVFFDNLNIRTPLTRDISLLATVTREITVDLHDSLLYWIPVKWFLVFWGSLFTEPPQNKAVIPPLHQSRI